MLQYTTVELLAPQSFPRAIEVSHTIFLSLNSACPVHYTSSEVQYFKRSTMYFVVKYPLKCSEVCFEVQRSAYFAALGLHCRRTWDYSLIFWAQLQKSKIGGLPTGLKSKMSSTQVLA